MNKNNRIIKPKRRFAIFANKRSRNQPGGKIIQNILDAITSNPIALGLGTLFTVVVSLNVGASLTVSTSSQEKSAEPKKSTGTKEVTVPKAVTVPKTTPGTAKTTSPPEPFPPQGTTMPAPVIAPSGSVVGQQNGLGNSQVTENTHESAGGDIYRIKAGEGSNVIIHQPARPPEQPTKHSAIPTSVGKVVGANPAVPPQAKSVEKIKPVDFKISVQMVDSKQPAPTQNVPMPKQPQMIAVLSTETSESGKLPSSGLELAIPREELSIAKGFKSSSKQSTPPRLDTAPNPLELSTQVKKAPADKVDNQQVQVVPIRNEITNSIKREKRVELASNSSLDSKVSLWDPEPAAKSPVADGSNQPELQYASYAATSNVAVGNAWGTPDGDEAKSDMASKVSHTDAIQNEQPLTLRPQDIDSETLITSKIDTDATSDHV
jgi:hypothetical protein